MIKEKAEKIIKMLKESDLTPEEQIQCVNMARRELIQNNREIMKKAILEFKAVNPFRDNDSYTC